MNNTTCITCQGTKLTQHQLEGSDIALLLCEECGGRQVGERMSYIVNEKAEQVFNLLRNAMNTTNMDLQNAAGTFQNFGVELTDRDLLEFETNLEKCWTNLKKVTDHARTIYREAIDVKRGGMYSLNSNFDVVNLTIQEIESGCHGSTQEQLLNRVDDLLNFEEVSPDKRDKLLTIKENLIKNIKGRRSKC